MQLNRFSRMFLSYVKSNGEQWRKRVTLTSKPCNLPTSIISFAALGITRMTWAAALRPSISDNLWVRSVRRSASRRRSWYFVILCTGLINKSQSCRRWPSFCLSSYKHVHVCLYGFYFMRGRSYRSHWLPRSKYLYIRTQCIPKRAYSDNKPRTCATFARNV